MLTYYLNNAGTWLEDDFNIQDYLQYSKKLFLKDDDFYQVEEYSVHILVFHDKHLCQICQWMVCINYLMSYTQSSKYWKY